MVSKTENERKSEKGKYKEIFYQTKSTFYDHLIH